MENQRKCWYNSDKLCYCQEDSNCIELRLENARLLYCNDHDCKFNIELPYEHFIDRGKMHKPFKDDAFTGVCGRSDVGLSPKTIMVDRKFKNKVVTCRVRSDRSLNRPHLPDPDKIEGGSYPDPIDPHSAFHG